VSDLVLAESLFRTLAVGHIYVSSRRYLTICKPDNIAVFRQIVQSQLASWSEKAGESCEQLFGGRIGNGDGLISRPDRAGK
jgi:hypothetical protein